MPVLRACFEQGANVNYLSMLCQGFLAHIVHMMVYIFIHTKSQDSHSTFATEQAADMQILIHSALDYYVVPVSVLMHLRGHHWALV